MKTKKKIKKNLFILQINFFFFLNFLNFFFLYSQNDTSFGFRNSISKLSNFSYKTNKNLVHIYTL